MRVVLSGNVSQSALKSPLVGLLLRQGISCYLGLPVASVKITSVAANTTSASSDSASLAVRADDPVNTGSAVCSSNETAHQLRMLQGASTANMGVTVVSLKVW